MSNRSFRYVNVACLVFAFLTSGCTAIHTSAEAPQYPKIVIAHRGASGYLPEHTLAAKAMAHAQRVDYIEQDLVMTKDDKVIVLHDHHLDQVTNVRDVFPNRHRDDGRYFVIDFTLEEIRSLSVVERFQNNNGIATPVFAGRFPFTKSRFAIHTFAEEIELIQGLNKTTGRSVGIYPEIKSPAFHRKEGKNISLAVLNILKSYGYFEKSHNVYVQCFDWTELKHIHDELMPQIGMDLRLVQLLPATQDDGWIQEPGGIAELARVADGVGPSIHQVVERESPASGLRITNLVVAAHAAGLQVHPYTFRRDSGEIPAYASGFNDLLDIFLFQIGVDGIFTDFPDLAVSFIESRVVSEGHK